MTNEVKARSSVTEIAGRALRQVTDEIIRTEPGVYRIPHPDGGGVWVCPYGSGKSPRFLRTSPGLTETSQMVEVYSSDGTARRYAVMVSIKEVRDERREEHVSDEESGRLPAADGTEGPEPKAATEA